MHLILVPILAVVVAFTISYLSIPAIVRVCHAKKLYDEPDKRKLNKTVVPSLGGVAIFISITVSSMLCLSGATRPELRFLYAAMLMVFFIGIKDDLMVISPRKKLLIQIFAGVVMVVLGNYRVVHLYSLGEIDRLYLWISIPLSVFIFLYLINAVNLIDGIDGLAGGISLFIFSFMAWWFYQSGDMSYTIISLSVIGSLLAFLRFNLSKGENKIFMGDTGSLLLGLMITAFLIKFNETNSSLAGSIQVAQAPLICLALVIVPVTDTMRVFIIRLSQGRSPFSPDKNHIHHLLLRLGLTHGQSSTVLVLVTAAFVAFAFVFSDIFNITINIALMLITSFSTVGITSIWANKSKRKQYSPLTRHEKYRVTPLKLLKRRG